METEMIRMPLFILLHFRLPNHPVIWEHFTWSMWQNMFPFTFFFFLSFFRVRCNHTKMWIKIYWLVVRFLPFHSNVSDSSGLTNTTLSSIVWSMKYENCRNKQGKWIEFLRKCNFINAAKCGFFISSKWNAFPHTQWRKIW